MPKKRTMIYSNVKQNKKKAEEISRIKDDQINLDDEVFIGLSKSISEDEIKEKKQIKNNNGKKNQKKKQNIKQRSKQEKIRKIKKDIDSQDEIFIFDKDNKKNVSNKKRKLSKVKISILLIIIVAGIVAFLSSPIFNIKTINVNISNGQILTSEEIIALSNINIGENIFSMTKRSIRKEIEKNPYVESVKVSRQLPGKLKINIVERKVKYQIENEGKYYSLDDKGYILDEVEERKEVILISGYASEDLNPGSRMNEDDLNKLSDVNVILQEAKSNELEEMITKIDISDNDDYKIYFDNEGKVAYIGDTQSINDKMAYVKKILDMESDFEGEIFVNVDLSGGEYPYFREKV